MLVFVAAMIPKPGETAATGGPRAASPTTWGGQEMGAMEHFLHDLPPTVLQEALKRGEPRRTRPGHGRPVPAPGPAGDPDASDRGDERPLFSQSPFMNRLIRDRLGVDPEHVVAGHLPARQPFRTCRTAAGLKDPPPGSAFGGRLRRAPIGWRIGVSW